MTDPATPTAENGPADEPTDAHHCGPCKTSWNDLGGCPSCGCFSTEDLREEVVSLSDEVSQLRADRDRLSAEVERLRAESEKLPVAEIAMWRALFEEAKGMDKGDLQYVDARVADHNNLSDALGIERGAEAWHTLCAHVVRLRREEAAPSAPRLVSDPGREPAPERGGRDVSHRKNAHRVIRVGLGPGLPGIRQISVDLRVFWPHDVDHQSAVLQVLDTAYQEVRAEIQQGFAARPLPDLPRTETEETT
jgi:predicted  nucleic acid-binding Zn-ribbon protein